MNNHPAIVIIGCGFSGIGMAIQLKKAGFHDFAILEKNDALGGTWWDNKYPGCACDVPSHMYSFSYELNPEWSRMFAPQPEIWEYLQGCVRKYGIAEHIQYGCAVERMEWDDAARRWRVTTTAGDVYTARAIVSGTGALHVPSVPEIPGADRFGGPAFHSAQWDSSADLAGKRVAVVGTGASAIQIVPEIAKEARQVYVFQRTPPWIHPRPDFEIPAAVRTVFRTAPPAMRAFRDAIYWALEARALGFAVHPRLMAPLQKMALRHIKRQIDDPELRARVTPDYTIGCKRILLSSDYYPTLMRPNVELVTEPIAEITRSGVVGGRAGEETAYDVDVIIYGTGFKVIDTVTELNVTGRDGVKLQDAWQDGVEAFFGITVPGFPNLFLLLGPNTGLGHNSVVFMIESQVQHVMSCLRMLARDHAETIEVKASSLRRFNDAIQRRLRRAVWSEGGCKSWYLDADGVNRTLWPGFSFEYWARARRARRADYVIG
jgi:cation diffusion facilitator CzcD-associated flavoprotein CzcO